MIHGKKRNGNLFKRLTESWGYVKEESEETPLDEQMVEEEEVKEEGVYKRDEDEELDEGGTADRPESKEKGDERVAAADRGRRVDEAGDQ